MLGCTEVPVPGWESWHCVEDRSGGEGNVTGLLPVWLMSKVGEVCISEAGRMACRTCNEG